MIVVCVATLFTSALANAQQSGGLPAEIAARIAADADLQNQIDTIELTPGPEGPAGADGAQGPAGADGAEGPPGECNCDITRAEFDELVARVDLFTNVTETIPCSGDCPEAGWDEGSYSVPEEAQAMDSSFPDQVVGNGTPESCTSEAVVAAVANGGVITFNCGSNPVAITLTETAKVFNDTGPEVVIDGGGLVTLSGGNQRRILYMNTCDQDLVWTTAHCQDQDHPRLTVQNLTFVNGDASGEDPDGGGAIFVRGGRFKIVNCSFFNNRCDIEGPDVGGGAVRVLDQYNDLPVYVVGSTFGGRLGLSNVGSNGGALSSFGVSWTVINSLISHNQAIGNGGNPAQSGTPGGGSGGAIYNDGNTMTLTILGSLIEQNMVNAHGSAILFVSNDHSGNIIIDQSTIQDNIGGSWYPVYPGISAHADTDILVTSSTIE